MKVDIEIFDKKSVISFKQKDFTKIDELRAICCAMANRFCFEAGSLWSDDFESFVKVLQPRKTYWIIVGISSNGNPIVQWGVLE
ncbi:hypothetical protein LU632_26145 (plasmid) [Erwinia tracheiphila]|uniref:hypothetical protein n=1 Tax=Erwinia tracheiphila TaxID=65700 RepID=UPI001F360C8D|nr:hypothetical protein [Erwinia tracheiphila]UIA94520.1 hypothetical protein LU632_26145 [Erwinia tracheiphila]